MRFFKALRIPLYNGELGCGKPPLSQFTPSGYPAGESMTANRISGVWPNVMLYHTLPPAVRVPVRSRSV
jgi:hypothetical protein